jgi:hypothetical protein
MNMKISVLLVLFLFSIMFSARICAQDLDAGITIIGKRNEEQLKKEGRSKLTITNNFGIGSKNGGYFKEGGFVVNTITAEGDFHIYKTTRILTILPYSIISGPAATIHGFGDMLVLCTSYFPFPGIGEWGVSLGAKFSSGSADKNGLYQAYQPALGTNDLLIGVVKNAGLVNFAVAYQHPFDRSNNTYTKLKRGDDFMLRFGITQPFKKSFLQAEIIGIKRIQKSNILVFGSNPEQYVDVDNSNQFQVNLLGRFGCQTSENIRLELYGNYALLKRDDNSDGLSRLFSVAASFILLFDLH